MDDSSEVDVESEVADNKEVYDLKALIDVNVILLEVMTVLFHEADRHEQKNTPN